jgi:glycosyltransferase involved in cell wall biosynthesis
LAVAFQKLLQSDKELKLICVGPTFEKFEIEQLKKLKILNNILNLGVNEKQLNDLYAHALAFVNPSMYEGFGMSILEAFANNCVVCLSNATCFPEIAADAAMYFDPYNSDSLAEAISKVIYDSTASENFKQLAQERLKLFSWNKCARQTYYSYCKTLQ